MPRAICYAAACGLWLVNLPAEGRAALITVDYLFYTAVLDTVDPPEVIESWTDPDPPPSDSLIGNHYYEFEKYKYTVRHQTVEERTAITYDPDYQAIALVMEG